MTQKFTPTDPKAQQAYKPVEVQKGAAYTGQYNAAGGAQQLQAAENTLGAGPVDISAAKQAQLDALRASTAEGLKTQMAGAADAGGSRGLGGAGTTSALKSLAASSANRTNSIGAGQIEQDLLAKQLQQNQFRTQAALGVAGDQLQNEQFGAQFGEGQRQFDTSTAVQQNQFGYDYGEKGRQADNSLNYQSDVDQYQANVIRPQDRTDARKASQRALIGQIVGGVAGGAGAVGGAALACRGAEAAWGIDHPVTERARYALNVIAPVEAPKFFDWYVANMHAIADLVKRSPTFADTVRSIFSDLAATVDKAMTVEGLVYGI